MIAVLGGGIAGLVAAINLENNGKECILIEKENRLGGRVGTDMVEGLPLDHGFQVLLTDYPNTQKYLNYAELDLQNFEPGAYIFKEGKKTKFGDPLRDISNLFPTLFSWSGTLSDKLKVYKLSTELGLKTVEQIFMSPESSTLDYLKKFGFSDQIIKHFFKPFFGGIFLESALETSSRMFEFVFKMFANGFAAIPAKGMSEIPEQLKSQLKKTKFILGTEAEIMENGEIQIKNDRSVKVDGIVKAYSDQAIEWKGCTTLYYKVKNRILKGRIIGLLTDKGSTINSFHYLSDEVLSVTSLHAISDEDIDLKVREELKSHLDIEVVSLLRKYAIPRSLPALTNIGEGDRSSLHLVNGIPVAHAGDHLYYGSLNAAMHSGEVAAQSLLDHFSSRT